MKYARSTLGSLGRQASWSLMIAAVLVGTVIGNALPRPFEALRAAQPPSAAAQPQEPRFPGAQPPAAGQDAPADAASAAAADAADEAGTDAAGAAETDASETDTDAEDEEEAPPIATRTFEDPAGLVMNFVAASGASDFERVTRQLVQAMAASEDPELQGQAAGWKMYRVREPGPNNNTVFVWLFDPVVTGANYAAPQLLNESFPEQVQQLYETFNESFGLGQVSLNLEPVELVP